MSDVAQRYQRLTDAFADKVAAVPPDKWDSPSPCPDWTTRDLVKHVVADAGHVPRVRRQGDWATSRRSTTIPWPRGTPRAARSSASSTTPRPRRRSSTASSAAPRSRTRSNRFLCVDQIVHGWDLARAAGLDEKIAPDDIECVRKQAEFYGDAMRSPQAFGPEVEAPAGASDQDEAARVPRPQAVARGATCSAAPRPTATCRRPSSGSP